MSDQPVLQPERRMPNPAARASAPWQIPDGAAEAIVRQAIETGYAMIDTAAIYRNEAGVGKGIGQHNDIFLQTKIWNESQGTSGPRSL
jgi:diketogulonate reductase-like aldo/keto reductase